MLRFYVRGDDADAVSDMQGFLWIAAAASAGVAGGAALADRQRMRRVRRDRVGWVPWGGVFLAALFVAAICAALALKG